MTSAEERVVVGKITSAHGIRGEVKVSLFVDDPSFLSDVKTIRLDGRPPREIAVRGVRFHSGSALLLFEGVTDRTEAERLRGRELSVPLSLLPALDEDEYYVSEIVGLQVESSEGEPLGTLEEVIFTGANEVYVLRGGPHGEILIPAIESVVQSVDLEGGRMVVALPDGLIE